MSIKKLKVYAATVAVSLFMLPQNVDAGVLSDAKGAVRKAYQESEDLYNTYAKDYVDKVKDYVKSGDFLKDMTKLYDELYNDYMEFYKKTKPTREKALEYILEKMNTLKLFGKDVYNSIINENYDKNKVNVDNATILPKANYDKEVLSKEETLSYIRQVLNNEQISSVKVITTDINNFQTIVLPDQNKYEVIIIMSNTMFKNISNEKSFREDFSVNIKGVIISVINNYNQNLKPVSKTY